MKTLLVFAASLALVQAAPAAPVTPFPNQALQGSDLAGHTGLGVMYDVSELRPAGAFTLEAWVRAEPTQSLSAYPIAITKPVGTLLNGECSYGFVFDRATGRVTFRVTTTDATYNATGPANLLDGAWHHLAGVRETAAGAQLRLVVDGVQVASISIAGSNRYGAEGLCVGGVTFTGYTGNYLVGQVDEVRLWNIARSTSAIALDRARVYNAQPGLALAFHFDQGYPDSFGGTLLRDSVVGAGLGLRGDATLTLTSAPISRGVALYPRGVLGQVPGELEHAYGGVTRVAGGRDLVHRTYFRVPVGYGSELVVVDAANGSGLVGALQLPANGVVTGVAARDSVAFCLKLIPGMDGFRQLFAVRIVNGTPIQFGDSVLVRSIGALTLDSTDPNQVTLAGTSSTSNFLSVYDVTNAGAPIIEAGWAIGDRAVQGTIVDVARRGPNHFVTFTDGSLRGYRYDVSTRQMIATGFNLALTDTNRVAISGTRLYVASAHGVLRLYDITTPSSPAMLGGITLTYGRVESIVADGNRVALAGPNGAVLVDASDPAMMRFAGDYCADMPGLGLPYLSLRNGTLGMTSGLAGYTALGADAVLAVEPPAPEGAMALRAQPNPARGTTWFTVPAGVGLSARLEVFDVRGRRVRSLPAVAGRIAWDGEGDDGTLAPAGVYFARVTGLPRACEARIVRLR